MKKILSYKQFEFVDVDSVLRIKINDHWFSFEYVENMLIDLGYINKTKEENGEYLIINKVSEENKIFYLQNKITSGNFYNLPDDIDLIVDDIKKLENITI